MMRAGVDDTRIHAQIGSGKFLIATAIDRNFVEPACVLLASIAANAAVPDAELLVFGVGLKDSDHKKLRESCGVIANKLSIVDLAFAIEHLKRLPTTLNVPSVAAFARLLVPSWLPPTARRLLYLDSDIVVIDSLRPLFDTPLGDAIVAAVPDLVAPFVDRSFRTDVLKLPNPEFYFNSGVVLLDVEAWQRQSITKETLDFIARLPARTKLMFPDQDVLNAVLVGRWYPLENKWNYFKIDSTTDLRQIQSEAAVVHYASGHKPWVSGRFSAP